MKLSSRLKIMANPKSIETMNFSSELVSFAVQRGYELTDELPLSKFELFIFSKDFVLKFFNTKEFHNKLKQSNNYKDIYEYVFDSNIEKLCGFYSDRLMSIYDDIVNFLDKKELNNYMISNCDINTLPKKIYLDSENLPLIESKLLQDVNANIESIANIEKLLKENNMEFSNQFKNSVINSIESNTISSNYPTFLLQNRDYIVKTLINNPKEIEKIDNIYSLELTDEEKNKIANTIRNNNIVFTSVPDYYRINEKIFKEIIKNNPKLLDTCYDYNPSTSDEELANIIEYSNYSITQDSPYYILNNARVIISSLKNDFSSVRFIPENINLTEKELYFIYQLYIKQNVIDINENKFLQRNPFIIVDCLINNKKLDENIDLSNVDNYYLLYYQYKYYQEKGMISDEKSTDLKNPFENQNSVSINTDNKTIACCSIEPDMIEQVVFIRNNYYKDYKIVFDMDREDDIDLSRNIDYLKRIEDRNNIYFDFGDDKTYTIDQVISDNDFLDYCVKDIKDMDSELEKYLAVYTIAKNIKKYKKDNITNIANSERRVFSILNNNYIVCAGYANLLVTLLDKIGIESTYIGCDAGEPHAIVGVKIDDSKYGVSGEFLSDPTWDNGQKNGMNSYGNAALYQKANDERHFLKLSSLAGKFEAEDREQAIDPTTLVNAIMEVKKKTFKNMSELDYLTLEKDVIESCGFSSAMTEELNKINERRNQLLNILEVEISDKTIKELMNPNDRNYIYYKEIINNSMKRIAQSNYSYGGVLSDENEFYFQLKINIDQIPKELTEEMQRMGYEMEKHGNNLFVYISANTNEYMTLNQLIDYFESEKQRFAEMGLINNSQIEQRGL